MINIDTSAVSSSSGTSPVTWTHSCGNNATVIIFFVFSSVTSATQTVTAATYNGVNLTQVTGVPVDSTAFSVDAWILVNPPKGSNTCSVSFNSIFNIKCFSLSLNLTGNNEKSATNTSSSTPISTDITGTSSNATIIDFVGSAAAGTITLAVNSVDQTEIQNVVGTGANRMAMSYYNKYTGGGTFNMTWKDTTGTGPSFAHIVLSFKLMGQRPYIKPTYRAAIFRPGNAK